METKKTPKADLENKRGLFLEIGLVVALLIVILVFGYNQKDRKIEMFESTGLADEVEMVEITKPEEPKPVEPVKQTISVVTDILNVVKNDTKITTDFDFVEFSEDEIVVQPIEVQHEEIEEDAPFITAEQMPTFQGGDLSKFREWVIKNFQYPAIARENGIQGRGIMTFVIERDGSLTNIQALVTPDRVLSDEVARVLAMSPKWAPGKQRNQPVRIKYTMPVEFRISN